MLKLVSEKEKRILASCLANPTAYNIPLFIRFGQGLNIPKMYQLLSQYFENYNIFRTYFKIEESFGKNKMFKGINQNIPLIQIRSFGQFDQDTILHEHLLSAQDGELIKVVLCKVTGEPADYLFLNIHHVLFDGFSINLLLHDLLASYLRDEPSSLQDTTYNEAELEVAASVQVGQQRGDVIDFSQYDLFKTKLIKKQANVVHYLNDQVTLATKTSRRHSDFALCLTAFSLSLAEWLQSQAVYMVFPSLGRNRNQYRTLGSFVQFIPFAEQFDHNLDTPIEEIISGVQQQYLSNMLHSDLTDLQMRREPMSRMNLFRDIVFDYKTGSLIDKVLDQEHEITLEEATAYRDEKYGLHFSIYQLDNVLHVSIISSEFTVTDVERFSAVFNRNIQLLYSGESLRLGNFLNWSLEEQSEETAELSNSGQSSEEQSNDDLRSKICEMVCELLEETEVAYSESFFDLGMDSTLLVKLKKRIKEMYNVNLKISDFFNHYTTELLFQKIRGQLKEAN
ncbi:hypothetical protein I6N90_19950 [Paenibacillus sp. GSMTC-2017]|uniref:condensation domain-containing protein n=1 Tax=Paenibacillus sp. GSMTC-2017 TaxID=2794350 RepID=UPI0018D94108|nr:condensation domain-containing protein [Paenibacillus sp. GSMTC-2017]MBH5320080.1 hypothetical protein [Paenibacillus sp. GSMTC-2017]